MSTGIHWEWRGFGAVSSRFIQKFSGLPVFYESHHVKDEYLWIPGLGINAKFRTGAEGGLKFKRLKDKDGDLEKWEENPYEIFDFPLEHKARKLLSNSLKPAGISLTSYPVAPAGRSKVKEILKDVGCKIITAQKERETRRWNDVLIEKAVISQPQKIISIGLENLPDGQTHSSDKEARAAIRSAVDFFDLQDEGLRIMNYLEAIKIWAQGKRI